jgi:hypothetical protein
MRLLSFTGLLFFFTLIMVLHGKAIRKRDTGQTSMVSTNHQIPSNNLPAAVNRDILRRRRFRMFTKK